MARYLFPHPLSEKEKDCVRYKYRSDLFWWGLVLVVSTCFYYTTSFSWWTWVMVFAINTFCWRKIFRAITLRRVFKEELDRYSNE